METSELIQSLRFCGDKESVCTACNRYDEMGIDGGTNACMCDLMQRAADAIEALQAELRDEIHRHDRLQDFEVAEGQELSEARAKLKQLFGCGECEHCNTEYDQEPCNLCRQDPKFPAWKWRGRS